jgi:hypothetical protein
MKVLKLILSLVFIIPFSMNSFAGPTGQDLGEKWCKDVKMHFYAGGPEAGGFAGIVAAGAMNAIRDTGADAEIHIQSGTLKKWFVNLESQLD